MAHPYHAKLARPLLAWAALGISPTSNAQACGVFFFGRQTLDQIAERSLFKLGTMTSWRRVPILLVSLSGCGNAEIAAPVPEPRLVLGTGESEFSPIDGEPRASLVAGAQGGFHVWAAFLAYGFDSTELELLLTTSVEDDADSRIVLRGHLMLHETLDATGEPALSFAGFPAQVYDARCAQNKRVRLDARVSDTDGAVAEDTRYIIADIEEMRRSDSCQ